jgi:hydrogenase nickel incorporation protein HypA/HybF
MASFRQKMRSPEVDTFRLSLYRSRGQTAVVHELGIMQSALGLVAEHARRENASRVVRIVLRIGELSGVEPDALRFAFDAVTPGTVAAGAALQIDVVPPLAHCASCQQDFAPENGSFFQCPHCAALSSSLKQGRELDLVRIEMI